MSAEIGDSRLRALFAKTSGNGMRPLFWQSLGYAILPLRLFLGFTFVFAGLQKLANPNFFNPKSPMSIQSQIVAYQRFSPLHLVLHAIEPMAAVVGFFIAFAELAVGLGVFFGVLTRLAALGGMIISLTLFLTVSFHSNPYYTGSDIVFLFAMTPIAIGGNGGIFSLSSFIRRKFGMPTETVVAAGFQMIQQTCGAFEDGLCRLQQGSPCGVRSCPILVTVPMQEVELKSESAAGVDRRNFLSQVSAVGVLGAIGVGTAATTAYVGRQFKSADPVPPEALSASHPAAPGVGGVSGDAATTTSTTSIAGQPVGPKEPLPKGATEIGNVSELGIGKVASFVDPVTKSPAYILRPQSAKYVAYSAICPHAGCTVQYNPNGTFVCPCHGSTFDALTGAVEIGPAPRGLTAIPITISQNKIYADPPG